MSPEPDGWPPPPEALWLVDGSMGAVVEGHDKHERSTVVALRVGSRRNLGTERDDRTYVLRLDDAVEMLAGLMTTAYRAWGQGTVMTGVAEALGVTPEERDRTAAAVDRALDDERGDR